MAASPSQSGETERVVAKLSHGMCGMAIASTLHSEADSGTAGSGFVA